MKPKCEDCYYWIQDKEQPYGYCHRFPPTPIASVYSETEGQCGEYRTTIDSNHVHLWPETYPDDFCGEFKMSDMAKYKQYQEAVKK